LKKKEISGYRVTLIYEEEKQSKPWHEGSKIVTSPDKPQDMPNTKGRISVNRIYSTATMRNTGIMYAEAIWKEALLSLECKPCVQPAVSLACGAFEVAWSDSNAGMGPPWAKREKYFADSSRYVFCIVHVRYHYQNKM
jgi:hypothetical protein